MDAKKLQQLQQANAQKKLPLAYQTNIADYRTATHSPLFQQQQQSQVGGYQMHQPSLLGGTGYQQSPTTTSSSGGGGPLSPIDMQPQPNKLLLKHHLGGSAGNTSSSSHSSPYHQSYTSGEQVYQSPNERTYLAAAGRLASTSNHNAVSSLQQQYQQLQQAKLQAQLQTQSEAAQQQQRTFALRQAMNPPVPGHYHMSGSSSIMSSITLQQQQQQQLQAQQQQQHQRAPPSTLNLSSQFQPAAGPLKVNPNSQTQHYHQDQAQLYAQQQQQLQMQLQHQQQLQQHQQQQQPRLKAELQQTPGSEHSPVYIQQNHPGHVVNQACQTQISAVKSGAVVQKTTPSPEDTYGKSPSHAPLDRKKSVGSIQALKSPITKRAPTSPVTLSGWLYKQGSDGLKVWRKRWFVLAEYCLYYYKGPEEEKLLGSILLPSYKVSACLPEDKIYRKFAFKCEHQNMRTYWLAAETAEAMVQWVRALTAAAMMQGPSSGESDQTSQPSAASSLNHSGENSDSGIHTLQSQQSKMSQGQVTPASDSGNMNTGTNNSGGAQPLYANAPPKPRRINDGGYSSPSPEHSIDNERKHQHQVSSRRSGIMSPTLQQMQQQQQYQLQQQQRSQQQPQQHHAIYDARTGNVSSTLRLQQSQQKYSVDNLEAQFQQQISLAGENFGKSPTGTGPYSNYMDMEEQILRLQHQQQLRAADDVYSERELYMQKLMQQRYAPYLTGYPNAERRTPDAYGRSKNRVFSDYEDIYNLAQSAGLGGLSAQEALLQEAASYRRPLSPPSYDGTKHVPAMPSRYTPNPLEATTVGSSNSNLRSRPAAGIMRPHSADFLEYEARAEAAAEMVNATSAALKPDAMRAPRPKSSLDINRTPDSVYYSEASYAEKMRKSALYLQHPQGQTATGAQPQQAVGVYRTAAADFTSPTGTGMNTIGYENPYERAYKRNEMLQDAIGTQGAASIPRMSRSMGGKSMPNSSSSNHLRSASLHPQPQTLSPTQPKQPYFSPSMSTQQIIQQNEQFLRSASARLPKRNASMDDEYHGSLSTATSPPTAPSLQDGERKREESMKRLLEWKQRMLQSPLTRKSVQQAGGSNMSAMSKLGSNPNILLASTTVASGAHYGPPAAGGGAGTAIVGGVSAIQRSRSESHANNGPAGYNSYSSDDEDGTNVKAPAGRSTSNTPTPPGSEATGNGCSSIKAAEVATTTALTTNSNTTIAQDTDNKTNNSKKASKFLKPILKIKPVNQSFEQEDAAKIETEHPVDAAEIPPTVPQNPPPPESPQITSYTPVYTTKLLSSTASKNYENVELNLQVNKEVNAEIESQQADLTEKVVALDPAETPMLMHLKLYTEQQKGQKPIDTTESTGTTLEEPSEAVDEPTDHHTSQLSDCDNDDDDTACEEYTDDDLDEALAEEFDVNPTEVPLNKIPTDISEDAENAQIYENERISSSGALEQLDESHYLPMTPKRSELNQTSCLTLVTDSNNEDENPYVIMSKYLNEEDSRGNYEVMCISPHNDALMLSAAKSVQHEPVYMELSSSQAAPHSEEPHSSSGKSTLKKSKKQSDTLKKKSKKSANERTQSKRKDLPDILKPSQSTLALASDSSDADDESSKHIDAKKLRSRSRFSLSDTFRPASYYLGASTPLANCAESSDSEIVSPPPIPASPPLLEALNTEEIFSSEHYDTVKRRDSNNSSSKLNSSYEQISKIHASNTSLNLTKAGAALKSSRLSLPDQFTKVRGTKSSARQLNKPQGLVLKHHERTLSDSNYSFQTDNSSNTSSDFDLYNKLKQNSPSFIASPLRYQSSNSLTQRTAFNPGDSSETDSVEFRQRQGSDSELERQRSRRPLSEDSISEIELLSEKFEETLNTSDLDTYLSHLQNSDCYLYQAKNEGLPLIPPAGTPNILIKPPEIFRNKNDEHFYGNIHFVSSTDSLQKLDNNVLTTPTSTDQDQSKYYTPMHSRNNSNISEQSAPYYYSELDSSREMLCSTPTSMTLNNQRDVHAHSSCNIAHIHNHIERPYLNVELLADKDQLIDSKNIYKMKTNIEKLSYSSSKNLRSGEPFQQATTSKQAFHLQQLQNAQIKLSNFQTNLSTSHSNVALTPSNKSHVPTQTQHPNQAAVQAQKHVAIPPCPGTSSGPEAASAGVISASTLVTGAKNTNVQMVYSEHSRSGEGTGTDNARTNDNPVNNSKPVSVVGAAPVSGELLWEEDTLWRESLRRVSQRHARSLDDLDRISTTSPLTRTPKVSKITREVTYVNENVSQHLRANRKPRLKEATHEANEGPAAEQNEHDVYVQLMASTDNNSSDVYELLREDASSVVSHKSSEIDREIIRQWDSMSSGLMKNPNNNPEAQQSNESSTGAGSTVKSLIQQINAAANEDDNGNHAKASLQSAASISVQNVRNLPKGNLTVKPDPTDPQMQHQQQLQYEQMQQQLAHSYYGTAHDTKYAKTTSLNDRNSTGCGYTNGFGATTTGIATSTPLHPASNGGDYYGYDIQNGYGPTQHRQVAPYPLRRNGSRAEIDMLERETSSQIRNLDVSAGDLLSRTHEELVLLLIQLRRQSSNTARAIEQCCTDIHEVQNRLRSVDGLTRAESIQRLDYLKQHLLDLERQYEKSKPLVNLVDNMVKLGSLYRNNDVNGQQQRPEPATLDRLEYNQRIQERRMLQEEQKQWDRLSPNHAELQMKVNQLYHLDQLVQEESGSLQTLQRDKEYLERTLGGLRARLLDSNDPSMDVEAAKKQQHLLERELSRVHQLLAENSKELEHNVTRNAILEQELLVLRQKLQTSRDTHGSQNPLMNGMESELKRVQTIVGDMQRQRQELSSAVRLLTENSNRLYQEIGNKENGMTGNGSSAKKRTNSNCWIETDLDSMQSINRSLGDSTMNLSTPLYVDTSNNSGENMLNGTTNSSKLSDYNTSESLHNERSNGVEGNYRYNYGSDNIETSGVDSDGFTDTNPFANLTNQEKQEIKTVRIVKRESERRHRDRSERNGLSNSTQNLDQVLEEEQYANSTNGTTNGSYQQTLNGGSYGEDYGSHVRSKSLPRTFTEPPKLRHHHSKQAASKPNPHYNGIPTTTNTPTSTSGVRYSDYYGTGYDKNSNYATQRHHANGAGNATREHLNPLANAYFAKQLQQQQQNRQSFSRDSAQTALRQKTDSMQSLNKSITDLSPGPVFQSEAARQIMNEMSAGSASEDTEKIVEKVPSQHKHRRAVPREKRRHYTAPNNVNQKAMENVQTESDMNRNNTNWRARDDLDMEVALRPRMNAPDVVRSALGHGEKISENTIDNLLLAPNKINIPERYIPEKTPELSPEEKKRRQEKVESIKKMLAEAPISTANDTVTLPPSKIDAERKQREHILDLNQVLAQQVMQMSKIVAERAMAKKQNGDDSAEEDERESVSPSDPLPLYQQRDNLFN